MFKYRLLVANSVLILALSGSLWGRRSESAAAPGGNFLRSLELPFRGWKSTDIELTPTERELLQPEAALVRRYESPAGEMAEIAVIAGRRKRSVHTPAYCMAGGGWELLAERECRLSLSGSEIPVVRSLMARNEERILVTYCFTDGEFATRSLLRFQAHQVLRRFRSAAPMGAMVRILVPASRDAAAAERLSDEFARAALPSVMASIRAAQVPGKTMARSQP